MLPHRIWFQQRLAIHSDRPLAVVVLILVTLIALLLSRASAAVHPVPLDPKVDSAKCLECHEDKSKGKAVHSAIAMGCLSCHEVRVNKDVTRVKLITTTPYRLCLTCHADKDATKIKGTRSSSGGSRLPEMPRSAYFGQQEPVAEGDRRRQERQSLPHLPHPGHECSGKGQPPRRARHGLRHLPHHAQDGRGADARKSVSLDEGRPGAVRRLP